MDRKQKIDEMIKNLQELKQAEQQGKGFKDIWNKVKEGYNWIRTNKPVSSTLKKLTNNPIYQAGVSFIPQLQPLDKLVQTGQKFSEDIGFGGILNQKKGRGRPKKQNK